MVHSPYDIKDVPTDGDRERFAQFSAGFGVHSEMIDWLRHGFHSPTMIPIRRMDQIEELINRWVCESSTPYHDIELERAFRNFVAVVKKFRGAVAARLGPDDYTIEYYRLTQDERANHEFVELVANEIDDARLDLIKMYDRFVGVANRKKLV